MNLLELQEKIINTIENVIEDGVDPKDVDISIQIETPDNTLWATDLELHYDNNVQASGCVLVGYTQSTF